MGWENDFLTSLTLPTGATSGARIVLDGTTDTELVYDASGNLIASIAATSGTDGFGNSYPAGISSSGGLISNSIFLLYNGSPAFGNLRFSIAANDGSDSFGNNYLAGFVCYDDSPPNYPSRYIKMVEGSVYIGAVDTVTGAFQSQGDANRLVGTQGVLDLQSSLIPSVPTINSKCDVALSSGVVGSATGSGSNPHVKLLSEQLAGPTPADFILSGSVVSCAANGIVNTWNTPTLGSNYNLSGTAGLYLIQYRIDGEDNVWINGSFNVGTAGTQALFSLPAGFRPALQAYVDGTTINSAPVGVMSFKVTTAGIVQPTANIATGLWKINDRFPRGNLP